MKLVKLEDAIRIAEELGYKVKAVGGWQLYYYLLDPKGQTISSGEVNATEAWNSLPQSVVERDGYEDDYSFVNGDDIQIVPESHTAEIDAIINANGPYGTQRLVLTRKDIEALMNGNAVVWGQGEYSSVIYFTEEKPE